MQFLTRKKEKRRAKRNIFQNYFFPSSHCSNLANLFSLNRATPKRFSFTSMSVLSHFHPSSLPPLPLPIPVEDRSSTDNSFNTFPVVFLANEKTRKRLSRKNCNSNRMILKPYTLSSLSFPPFPLETCKYKKAQCYLSIYRCLLNVSLLISPRKARRLHHRPWLVVLLSIGW